MANVINATSTGNGGLITTGDDSGVLNIQTNETTAVSIDASQNLTFTNPANLPNTFGMKNRVINGNMAIDQRNAGASVTTISGYTLDRWSVLNTSAGTVSIQQVTTAPSGFKYSAKLTVGTADTSVAAGDSVIFYQPIEGYNISDLGFGTAAPSSVTLSFWVNSALIGTYTGSIVAPSGARSYPFSYTVNAANTWEQKTVTLTADSSGTWGYTNDVGLFLEFSLMCGSTFQGTLNTWQAGNYRGTSSQVNWMATSGNTFYITGVQFEKGTQATSFDFRSYGTELALCQRYYAKLAANGSNPYVAFGSGTVHSTTSINAYVKYPQTMRTSPTITVNLTGAQVGGGAIATVSGIAVTYAGTDSSYISLTLVSSSFTNGQAVTFLANNSGSAYVDMSSEL